MKTEKYLSILLFFILVVSSCQSNKTQLTIPEDKLIKIFFDIHSAEYIINRAPADEKDSLTNIYMEQIYNIYKIDKNELEKNISILKSNPKKFKDFYEKLNKYGDSLLEKEKNKKIEK